MSMPLIRRSPSLRFPGAGLLLLALLAPLPASAQTAGVARKLGAIPAVPPFPPPPAVIPPLDNAPPHPTALPPPPTVDPHAAGAATPLADGVRITFAPGGADLNPTTLAAVVAQVPAGRHNPDLAYHVYAYAPGTPEDPSTPRRLSLLRGLAVQSALLHAGIPSTRVYVHALGATGPHDKSPPDRVDIRTALIGQTPAPPAPTPAEVAKP